MPLVNLRPSAPSECCPCLVADTQATIRSNAFCRYSLEIIPYLVGAATPGTPWNPTTWGRSVRQRELDYIWCYTAPFSPRAPKELPLAGYFESQKASKGHVGAHKAHFRSVASGQVLHRPTRPCRILYSPARQKPIEHVTGKHNMCLQGRLLLHVLKVMHKTDKDTRHQRCRPDDCSAKRMRKQHITLSGTDST